MLKGGKQHKDIRRIRMSSKKCFFAALLVLASVSFFTTESWAQSLSQYLVLNRVAYYKVRVHPEKVETANKGLKINLYILGGRIEGIIKGEFVQEKNIIVEKDTSDNELVEDMNNNQQDKKKETKSIKSIKKEGDFEQFFKLHLRLMAIAVKELEKHKYIVYEGKIGYK